MNPAARLSSLPGRLRRIAELLAEIGCPRWRPVTIFDVGANNGSSFAELMHLAPWTRLYAFEPTPELVAGLRRDFGRFRNFHLVPKAVGEQPGHATFNVAGQSDWGCSSLLEFADDLQRSWPGRSDFKVTQRIDVEVIRLDAFVREQEIGRIDFLHIDTQGTDLAVLRSLGTELGRVRGGVIEVPQNREVMLYRNQHTREQALEFLGTHGFTVWKISPQQNEDNLYFRRS